MAVKRVRCCPRQITERFRDSDQLLNARWSLGQALEALSVNTLHIETSAAY